MSNIENYNSKLETLKNIPEEEVQYPSNVPVDTYLQEAENLFHWCQDDATALSNRGLETAIIKDIPIRCGALREAQSKWIISRFTHEDAEKEWMAKSPEAYDFRDELLRTFRFAYRKTADILSRVNAIAEGYGHADMIQDLNDLSVLGKENPEQLAAIKFDMADLEKAADMADQMSDLLGSTTSERADSSEALKIRNQAYTHLKGAVDEVRDYGQFIFWGDDNRYKGYISAYIRRKGKKKTNKTEETTPDNQS